MQSPYEPVLHVPLSFMRHGERLQALTVIND